MAATRVNLSNIWQLVNNSGTACTIQALGDYAEIIFDSSFPAVTDSGFLIQHGQGLTDKFGTGNMYARGTGYVLVMT